MKCPNCNMENEENAKFCTSCGSKLMNNQTQEETASTKEEPENQADGVKMPEMPDLTERKIDWGDSAGTDNKTEAGMESGAEAEPVLEASENETEKKTETLEADTTAPMISAPVFTAPTEPEMPKKKKGKGIIIAAAAAIVVVGVAAAAFFGMQKKDPKAEVFDAFKSVYSSEEVKPAEEIFGFSDIFKNAQKSSTDYGLGLTLVKDNVLGLSSLEGAGFDMSEKNDLEKQVGSLNLGIIYGGVNFTNFKMYYDDTNFKASVPDLFDEVFVLNYADDLAGQIERSPYLGKYIAESGVDMDAFKNYIEYCQNLYTPDSTGPIDFAGLKERFDKENDSFKKLKDSIKVEKISEKKKFKVDGKEVTCRGFDMVVSKDNLIQFVDESCQFLLDDESLKQEMIEYYSQVMNLSNQMYGSSIYGDMYDGETLVNEMWDAMDEGITEFVKILDDSMDDEVKVTVYLDKQGRMISLEAETGLTDEDDSHAVLGLKVEMNGGAYLTQNMTASFTVDADGEKGEITFAKEGKYDKKDLTCDVDFGLDFDDELVEIAYSGSYNVEKGDYDLMLSGYDDGSEMFKMSVSGAIDDLEKGKGFRADADSIMITSGGMDLLELSGYYSIAPMEDEVEDLEGEPFDILAATESDWTNLIQSAYMKIFGLIGKLN